MRQAMEEVVKVWEHDHELRTALSNPAIPLVQRESVVRELAQMVAPSNEMLQKFLLLLFKNGRLGAVGAVCKIFAALLNDFHQILSLEVTSAMELSEDDRNALINQMRANVPPDMARTISVEWKVDREILGGLVIRAGDKVLDGSLSGVVERMQRELLAQV